MYPHRSQFPHLQNILDASLAAASLTLQAWEVVTEGLREGCCLGAIARSGGLSTCRLPPSPTEQRGQCSHLGCQHHCVPTLNGPTCYCNSSFQLQADGKTCKGECACTHLLGFGTCWEAVGGQWARLGRRKLEKCKTRSGSAARLAASDRDCEP